MGTEHRDLQSAQKIILDQIRSLSLLEIQTRVVAMLLPRVEQAYARAYINALPGLSNARTRKLYRQLVFAFVARDRRRAGVIPADASPDARRASSRTHALKLVTGPLKLHEKWAPGEFYLADQRNHAAAPGGVPLKLRSWITAAPTVNDPNITRPERSIKRQQPFTKPSTTAAIHWDVLHEEMLAEVRRSELPPYDADPDAAARIALEIAAGAAAVEKIRRCYAEARSEVEGCAVTPWTHIEWEGKLRAALRADDVARANAAKEEVLGIFDTALGTRADDAKKWAEHYHEVTRPGNSRRDRADLIAEFPFPPTAETDWAAHLLRYSGVLVPAMSKYTPEISGIRCEGFKKGKAYGDGSTERVDDSYRHVQSAIGEADDEENEISAGQEHIFRDPARDCGSGGSQRTLRKDEPYIRKRGVDYQRRSDVFDRTREHPNEERHVVSAGGKSEHRGSTTFTQFEKN